MVLVDTSIWNDHLRRNDRQLAMLLEACEVVCHPFVIGELACGSLARRHAILELLHALPRTDQAEHVEILAFIDDRRLHGGGIGLIDAHILWAAENEGHRPGPSLEAMLAGADRLAHVRLGGPRRVLPR